VIASDPKVRRAGIDAGFAPDDLNIRAPDVAIIPEEGGPGWIPGVPGFAVEYAGVGQDEAGLQSKIADFLARGTRVVWVVRLVGPRRVEVYEPNAGVRTLGPGETLRAPEFLENAVPVDALWDPEVADRVTLRNLLGRFGYRDVEAIREEGRADGREEGRMEGEAEGARAEVRAALRTVLAARGLTLDAEQQARVEREGELLRLRAWLERAATAASAVDALRG
jgi:hypothetical protein